MYTACSIYLSHRLYEVGRLYGVFNGISLINRFILILYDTCCILFLRHILINYILRNINKIEYFLNNVQLNIIKGMTFKSFQNKYICFLIECTPLKVLIAILKGSY